MSKTTSLSEPVRTG